MTARKESKLERAKEINVFSLLRNKMFIFEKKLMNCWKQRDHKNSASAPSTGDMWKSTNFNENLLPFKSL